ncbi:MAG: hypothetical protein M0P31_14845 [Solirubrobacteraceae bacterium]|nr:hypothetical protein [Solirubrobacteraceae bacterium]
MRSRVFPLAAAVLASVALTACGNKHDIVHHGESEAHFVDVGAKDGGPYVKYQVQISRQLNPGQIEAADLKGGERERIDPEDSEYFRGLTPEQLKLDVKPKGQPQIDNEVYFGVFIAAYNENHSAQDSVPISGIEIRDSGYVEDPPNARIAARNASHVFKPVNPVRAPNPFLYEQSSIPAFTHESVGRLPLANSPAGQSTAGGALLLFKIPQISLENRPLELHLKGPLGGEAVVDLDV